jgi:uncharacterized delta-60 repeat protein
MRHLIRWAGSVVAVAAGLAVTPAASGVVLATGKVTTDFDGGTDVAQAVAVAPDGKIVVAGGGPRDFFELARYNPNGSLDQTFGTGGKVRTDVVGRTRPSASAQAVALQPDGKIVAAGWSIGGTSQLRFGAVVVVRYTTAGALDPSFSGDGIVETLIGPDDPVARGEDMVIQADGRVVAVGSANARSRFAVVRYTTAGALDTTFDTDGLTTAGVSIGVANATVLQPDGRIVAAGYVTPATFDRRDFALARYHPDGALDATFGSGGSVTTTFPGSLNEARAVLLRPDGRLVAGGTATRSGGSTDFALAGYNPNGSLDQTFGTGGRVTTDFANTQDEGNGAVLQPDGRTVLAGRAGEDFALARYNVDGSLDSTFGQGGKVVTDFADTVDRGFAVALQRDGRIVVVGSSGNDFAIARYNANGSPDTTFG